MNFFRHKKIGQKQQASHLGHDRAGALAGRGLPIMKIGDQIF